jgi:hypothetical protein
VTRTAPPAAAASAPPAAATTTLEDRMRKMLGSINEERRYDMKSYAAQIAEAEKRLSSEYDVKTLKPPALSGINENTRAFAFDIGQVLYALKVVKVGPFEVCAGWMVTTRGPEQPPGFYVGPCKKNWESGDPKERTKIAAPTPPPLHN